MPSRFPSHLDVSKEIYTAIHEEASRDSGGSACSPDVAGVVSLKSDCHFALSSFSTPQATSETLDLGVGCSPTDLPDCVARGSRLDGEDRT